MKKAKQSLLLVLLLTLSIFIHADLASAQSQVLTDIQNSFLKLRYAEQQGANVTLQANLLTKALQLVQQGDMVNKTSPSLASSYYHQAEQIVQSVNSQINQTIIEGRAHQQAEIINLSLYLGLLSTLSILTYFYSDKVFWRLWLHYHAKWSVARRNGNKR
jgi:hypothetical protein